ncbi:PadR family transcriptional regulator [Sphingorhabdus sp. 109]|jgi:DNA-binding PadR family transcriptional regulator|uniref:PadR family transcriptional regulator n=1 Tax=Sphingorhabdus sp. 109 TaxID=2653173 RepID=UPI0012F1AE67|nr:PadR family transcriptional regulator [Sphingorhabdus sp. 109]VWX61037.1 conserved hypothetical protein [Sphingorhabdus sp. 109]
MSLKYAILVCLSDGPKSGYDIAKQFDEKTGFFWRARHSQIYRELGKMKDNDLARAEEVEQSGKPNRIVFTITEAGRTALLQWSREPSEPQVLKDDFLVQLYGIESIDLDALRRNLLLRLERHQDRHAEYLVKQKLLENGNSLGDLGRQLALDVGIRWEHEWMDWCTKALEKLHPDALADARATPTNIIPMDMGETRNAER